MSHPDFVKAVAVHDPVKKKDMLKIALCINDRWFETEMELTSALFPVTSTPPVNNLTRGISELLTLVLNKPIGAGGPAS